MTAERWQDEVLHFWFGLDPRQWWHDTSLDAAIRTRFETVWTRERTCAATDFLQNARDALAAVLLFDQFPRNMFRGQASSFATDTLAREIATAALAQGYEQMLDTNARQFLFMPLLHSETMADQDRSIALFETLGLPQSLEAAHTHRAMILRFGRFPSRNAALGRESTAEERAAGCPEPF